MNSIVPLRPRKPVDPHLDQTRAALRAVIDLQKHRLRSREEARRGGNVVTLPCRFFDGR